jgi:voltage-gated potassium channel
VGYRIYQALKVLGVPILVVERREDAAFVGALRAEGAAVLIEDASTAGTLDRVNLSEARAVVCATDDDLANVNIALDARRLKPGIRVVMRLFDDDLATRVEGAFSVDAFSTSALAAPSFAAAALDPGVLHSFWLAGELHVVAEITVAAPLAGRTVESLRPEQLLVALIERGSTRLTCPGPTEALRLGDQVHLQGPFRDYERLQKSLRPPSTG